MDLEQVEAILAEVIRQNPEKVNGWITSEPGCWGFLAGKAVAACRSSFGLRLEDQDRRLVWHRLWALLEQQKIQSR